MFSKAVDRLAQLDALIEARITQRRMQKQATATPSASGSTPGERQSMATRKVKVYENKKYRISIVNKNTKPPRVKKHLISKAIKKTAKRTSHMATSGLINTLAGVSILTSNVKNIKRK